MKILLTGANGFIGYYLVEKLLEEGHEVLATGRGENRLPFSSDSNFRYNSLDFTDAYAVYDIFEKEKPEVVIHAGANGKPDECEQDPMMATLVNVEGTLNMLFNAAEHKAFFIFLSTDFVFDGETGLYKEEDERKPVNFYGCTKMDAEDAVMEYAGNWCIIRTCLVYGRPQTGRSNLLTIVKKKLENKEPYKVVADQWRTPTYVEDLATAIVTVIQKKATGIFHISGDEYTTPYDFVLQMAGLLQLEASSLIKVTQQDFKETAQRPLKTGFSILKAQQELNYNPLSILDGLKKMLSL